MHIYEINAWTWITELSRQEKRTITFDTIPDDTLSTLKNTGVDAVWLMGVWERSPAGRKIATEHPDLQAEYRSTLPDFTEADIAGSPYSIHRYEVDNYLGGRVGLQNLRQRLKKLGLKLILDYVPNHVANDNPWLTEYPDAFVQGTAEELEHDPQSFHQVGDTIFAFGRDPYFPAWTDTTQVNAFSDAYRKLTVDTLLDIATLCDGVRCDMAMLLTNEVFVKTWSMNRVGEPPAEEYWVHVTNSIRAKHPEFVFMAEVYWDMEFALQQQGFDYCYDKRLYDRMVHESAGSINGHLHADLDYQNKLMRFIENHDEPRAMHELGPERSRMGAVFTATLPGGKLWHEGQFYGHRIKLPVQLGRRPTETLDSNLYAFYVKLITEVQQPVYREGAWVRRDVIRAWPENESNGNLVAYTWQLGDDRRLVVVNYSPLVSQGRVPMPSFGIDESLWQLDDVLNNAMYVREGDRMASDGLYIELPPYTAHIFTFKVAKGG